jgi:hypothetical protein
MVMIQARLGLTTGLRRKLTGFRQNLSVKSPVERARNGKVTGSKDEVTGISPVPGRKKQWQARKRVRETLRTGEIPVVYAARRRIGAKLGAKCLPTGDFPGSWRAWIGEFPREVPPTGDFPRTGSLRRAPLAKMNVRTEKAPPQ